MDERVRNELLRVSLNDDEVAERAIRLATLTGNLSEAEDTKARAAKQHGARVQEIRDELDKVSRVVRERAEWRDVEVRDVPDFEHGVMETFRIDTGARTSVRALTTEERQIRLEEIARARRAEGTAGIPPEEEGDAMKDDENEKQPENQGTNGSEQPPAEADPESDAAEATDDGATPPADESQEA